MCKILDGSKVLTKKVKFNEVHRFMVDCLTAAGAKRENAEMHTESLFDADYKGFKSHGMNRLGWYCKNLSEGKINAQELPQITKETVSSAHVDGKNILGTVVGVFCMTLAMKKAKETGFGAVSCNNSSHFGTCSFYTEKASKEGLLGFCCTNATPMVCPARTKEVVFGSNPISFAAPITENKHFLTDFATCVSALGSIDMLRKANLPIPKGFIHDPPPGAGLRDLKLLPLGSSDETGDFKGYGLAMMVEILASVLSNANIGPKVPVIEESSTHIPPGIGHFFYSIDPNVFCGNNFLKEISCLDQYIHDLEPVDKNRPIGVPGDREYENSKKVEKEKVIEYSSVQIDLCNQWAKQYKVNPIEVVN